MSLSNTFIVSLCRTNFLFFPPSLFISLSLSLSFPSLARSLSLSPTHTHTHTRSMSVYLSPSLSHTPETKSMTESRADSPSGSNSAPSPTSATPSFSWLIDSGLARRVARSHEEIRCLFGDRPRVVYHRVYFSIRSIRVKVWGSGFSA